MAHSHMHSGKQGLAAGYGFYCGTAAPSWRHTEATQLHSAIAPSTGDVLVIIDVRKHRKQFRFHNVQFVKFFIIFFFIFFL